MKQIYKSAFKFVLIVLPFALVAGISLANYEIGTGVITEEILSQVSKTTIISSITIQTVLYAAICGFIGYLLADKIGLLRSFAWSGSYFKKALAGGAICGILFFVLDYLIFAKLLVPVAEYYETSTFSIYYLLAKVLYGGMVEELMMRWFLMSLLIMILWKIFDRKADKESIPAWIMVVSNIVIAVLFALGHLPATIVMFGHLSFLIVTRCILLNGSFGLVFGRLYRKYGIQYAMVAHAVTHIVCDVLFFIFCRL